MTDKTDAELDEIEKHLREDAAQMRERFDLLLCVRLLPETAADALASLRKQLDEAREEKGNWNLRYEELKVDALDLHATNAQMVAAIRVALDHLKEDDAGMKAAAVRYLDAALSQEPPASHAPGLRDAVIEDEDDDEPCPTCGHGDLPRNVDVCPTCDADWSEAE